MANEPHIRAINFQTDAAPAVIAFNLQTDLLQFKALYFGNCPLVSMKALSIQYRYGNTTLIDASVWKSEVVLD